MKPRILKVSVPGFSQNATFDQYTDFDLAQKLNWEIRVNSGEERADAWFVLEDIPEFDKRANVARENIFYGSAETALPLGYLSESRYLQRFLQQFSQIFTHHDLYWPNVHSELPFLGWMINSNHGPSIMQRHHRDHKFLSTYDIPEKIESPVMSVFCSNQSMTAGHRLRFRFTQELKKYFGNNLVWFGNGVQSIPEKWEGLAPYRYSVVLENHPAYNVITEKLYDAFLTLTYPFYWGAPNVNHYFTPQGLTKINIEDIKESITKIASMIERNTANSQEAQEALIKNRLLVLNEYNLASRILRIAEKYFKPMAKLESVSLEPRRSFLTMSERAQNALIHIGHKTLNQVRRL